MNRINPLQGKVALITGGGSGIGRGIAIALAQEGVRVSICGRRMARLQESIELIHTSSGMGIATRADVTDQEDIKRWIEDTLTAYGRIDILVNNAGLSIRGQTHELEVEDWDRMVQTNLKGIFLVTRQVLPYLRSQKSGHIINISSEAGIEYYRKNSIYGLSKHAVNDFGEFLQRENQDLNIRVNTICPGMVVTEMTEDSIGLDESKCLYPQDIADLVVWLLTRRPNVKIGTPVLIQTMQNPWQ